MELQLSDKRALVTGSSACIGEAIAQTLAREGASVVVTGRDPKKAENVAQQIRAETRRAIISFAADLSNDEEATALAAKVNSEFGGVDILVNNHALYFDRGWWDTTPGRLGGYLQPERGFLREDGAALRASDARDGLGENYQHLVGRKVAAVCQHARLRSNQGGHSQSDCQPGKGIHRYGSYGQYGQSGNYRDGIQRQPLRKVAKAQGWPEEWGESRSAY